MKNWGFGLTSVAWRKGDLKLRLERRARLLSGKEQLPLQPTGEEGHLMMKALLGIGDMATNVNIPNRGQIPNMPQGAILETNAVLRRDQIAPVYAGPMDGNILALTMRHVFNQQNTLRAAREYDWGLALTTFMNDPQMDRVDCREGEKLFHQMIRAQRKYLPDAWKRD